MRPLRKSASDSTSPDPLDSSGHAFSQALEQPSFCFLRGRLNVDGQDILAQPRQEPAFTSDDLPQPEGP